jgi:hypothetical protein
MHTTTPRSQRRRRTGFALAFTLLAMTVLGALAGGVFFVTLRESRDARDALRRVRAVSAAEFGVYTLAASSVWNPFWNTTPQRGLLDARVYQPGDGSLDSVQVWKLSPSDFRVASEGYSGSGAARARHRVSLLLSLRGPHLVPRAAALVKEQATLSGDARISGADSAVAAWECEPPGPELPAIGIAQVAGVDTTACSAVPCLSGAPPVLLDSLAADSRMHEQFGAFTRGQIAALGRALPIGAELLNPAPLLDALGACDTSSSLNLGDPLRSLGATSPCAHFFPLAYAPESLHLSGGAGQGTLVVDGNLLMDAGARFFGVILVRDELHLTGAARFTGVAFASRLTMDGDAAMQLSRCAATRAFLALATPVRPPGLTWTDIP